MEEAKKFTDLELRLMKELTESNKYKEMSYKLWDLLDDIDTASDMFKPCEENGFSSYNNFYKYSLNKSKKRFELLKSDGYKLHSIEEFEKLPKEDAEYFPISESEVYVINSENIMRHNSQKSNE